MPLGATREPVVRSERDTTHEDLYQGTPQVRNDAGAVDILTHMPIHFLLFLVSVNFQLLLVPVSTSDSCSPSNGGCLTMRVWRRRNRTEAKVDCGEYGGGHRRECEEQGLCRARKDGGKNTIRKDVKREVEMVIIVVIVLGSTCCAKDRKRVAAALGRSSEARGRRPKLNAGREPSRTFALSHPHSRSLPLFQACPKPTDRDMYMKGYKGQAGSLS